MQPLHSMQKKGGRSSLLKRKETAQARQQRRRRKQNSRKCKLPKLSRAANPQFSSSALRAETFVRNGCGPLRRLVKNRTAGRGNLRNGTTVPRKVSAMAPVRNASHAGS